MEVSILIVSKNRKCDLAKTLFIIERYINKSIHEVLVLLDGCSDNSNQLKVDFNWVNWTVLKKSVGASKARNVLYKKAKGNVFIGFDDDAHPLQTDFIEIINREFAQNLKVGIIAFEEIKGVFKSDNDALNSAKKKMTQYYTNEFIGCGFAIRKDVYLKTNGFPVWIDIYGEESCLSIEVISEGYEILFSNKIKVNHRINQLQRRLQGLGYFRFGKQLKNTTFYYFVYYKWPNKRILKLYWHNFTKYGLKDRKYFLIFFKTTFEVLFKIPKIMKYRSPVDKKVLIKIKSLKKIKF